MGRVSCPGERGSWVKLALRDGMTPGETLTERLAWLDRAGFDGIELEDRSLHLPPDELREIFAASPVEAANVPGSGALLDPRPEERAAGKELTRRRLHLAGALGAVGVLVVPQFGRVAGVARPLAAADRRRAGARPAPPAAARAGARRAPPASPLFLEPLNRYEAYIVNRLEQGAAIAAEVGPEIGVMADFFHMNIEEADIAASIRATSRAPRLRPRRRQQPPATRPRPPRLPPRLPRPQRDRLRRLPRHRMPGRRSLRGITGRVRHAAARAVGSRVKDANGTLGHNGGRAAPGVKLDPLRRAFFAASAAVTS